MTISRVGLNYRVDAAHLAETQRLLRQRGELHQEGYVVWVGDYDGTKASVRGVWPVSAAGDGAHARVAFQDVLALSERVHERSWFILAQVHSHPHSAFHSAIDDQHPVSHQVGFISIVVPYFAARAPLESWSFNEHLGSGRWRMLDRTEAARRFASADREQEAWWKRLWHVITGQPFSSRH
jgi:hypothetical protein